MIRTSVICMVIGFFFGHVTAQGELYGLCDDSSNCTGLVSNAECRDDGTNTATKRCVCVAGYLPYNTTDNSTVQTFCGETVSSGQFPQCLNCENNTGVCYLGSVNDTSSVANTTRCFCPVNRSGNSCEMVAGGYSSRPLSSLDTLCSANVDCSTLTWNTECKDDGSNTGTRRCSCIIGYTSYSSTADNRTYCGQALSTQQFPVCSTCSSNEGVCYKQSLNDSAQDGKTHCSCPTSRTGVNCEIVTVNVTCTGVDLAMKVCYDPSHSGVSSTNGLVMSTDGHSNSPSCLGSIVTNSSTALSWCAAGNIGLVLSLAASRLYECGTTISYGVQTKSYQNNIVVQPSASSAASLVNFRAYCTFAVVDNAHFQPLGSQVVGGDNRGQVVVPDINLLVLNQYDQVIPAGVIVRVGDLIRFVFSLNRNSSSYNSMTVQFCTASSSAVMPDTNAETNPLIVNGCPASSATSGWYLSQRNAGDPNKFSVQTDQVQAFRMQSSTTVYVHCSVKLCLVDDSSCRLFTKTDCATGAYSGRKKRSLEYMDSPIYLDSVVGSQQQSAGVVERSKRAAATSQTVNIASKLDVLDPNSSTSGSSFLSALSSTGGIIAIIAVLLVVLIIVVIIGAAVMFHLKRHRRQADSRPTAPQQFVMRRIPQSTAVGYSRF